MGAWPFDFGGEVAAILEAIPDGQSMTPTAIAEALGDPVAQGAVADYLRHTPAGLLPNRAFKDADPNTRAGASDTPPLRRLQREQEAMARRAALRDDFPEDRVVAGADVAYGGGRAWGAVVAMDGLGGVAARATAEVSAPFPYIPTYLAYREFPALAAALEPIRSSVGLFMVEGHGALHPRGAGLATFVGLTLDLPTLGVARGPLGFPPVEPLQAGETRAITVAGRIRGYALGRGRERRPLYTSPGHRISAASAVRIAAAHCKFGMPEPLRLADALARKRKGERGQR